jgi:hypothetical protein
LSKVKNAATTVAFKTWGYYHASTTQPRKWTRLSEQFGEVLKAWASIEASPLPASNTTFAGMANLYRLQVIPTLRDKTQIDYHRHLDRLTPVFEHLQLAHIKRLRCINIASIAAKVAKFRQTEKKPF